jgi:hypothetical protein
VDFDGDGRMDILTGSISGKIHLFRRKPNGTYAAGETLKKGFFRDLTVGQGSSACPADWNGDGSLDLIIGNGEGAVYLVPNQGTVQKPSWGDPIPLKANGRALSADGGAAGPYVADWDNDGKLDLVLGSGSGQVVWCRNVGTKTKPELAAPVVLVHALPESQRMDRTGATSPERSGAHSRVCVADWNGDGRADLIVGDYAYERLVDRAILHGWVWVYLRETVTARAGD